MTPDSSTSPATKKAAQPTNSAKSEEEKYDFQESLFWAEGETTSTTGVLLFSLGNNRWSVVASIASVVIFLVLLLG
jgi:hypothetical protein